MMNGFGRGAFMASTAIVCAAAASPAFAQSRTFDVPAQAAATGIADLGRQADIQIVAARRDTQGKRTNAVKGDMTVDQALAALLKGTGLTARQTGSQTYSVVSVEAPAEASQPTAYRGDVIVVTAQKRVESIQDVPIAVTAFSEEALQEQKIESGPELMRGVPNVTFSKSNYSSYNFSIRGIGTKAVSATSDPGVAVSFNNVGLIRNRLFEQEYVDVERIEVLRGPQGTLYGRNATGGVVNLITKTPDLTEFSGSIKAEVGNYDSRRLSGVLNIPLIDDVLGIRLAGAWTKRDGYGVNLFNDDPIDGRDLWTGRATVGFEPAPWFRANLTWERFSEDDDRLRTGKQLCHRDPGPTSIGSTAITDPLIQGRLSQGCKPGSLYDDAAFGAPNGLSIPFIVAGQLLVALGTEEPNTGLSVPRVWMLQPGVDPYNVEQSRDLRAMESKFNPEYRAKADIFAANIEIDFSDALTLSSQTLYNEDRVYSFQDYNRFATQPTFGDSTGLYDPQIGGDPYAESIFQNLTPNGIFNDPQIGPADSVAGFEISSSESKQFTQEVRLQSDFDGPFNFSLGGNYTHFKGMNDYYLFFNIVTMISQGFYNRSADPTACNAFVECVYVDPNPLESLNGRGHNYFRNKNPYKLESWAGFGEFYWNPTDDLKITGGLRVTSDRKQFTPWLSQLLVTSDEYGPGDPINQKWTEATGRIGVDWQPELGFTDATLLYAFYSRGYKAGGANPPPAQAEDDRFQAVTPRLFEPEYVDAFEIGAKNTLMGGRLTLNASAFYYDYKDYQVSQVVDRTIVNENFDAKIWGLEFETAMMPVDGLRLNATVGYLDTKVGDGEKSIDIFDRTQGNPDWTVLTPWIQQTSNCILPTDLVEDVVNRPLLPPPATFASPIIIACQVWAGQNVLGTPFDISAYPEANNGAGFFDDLSGNELPNSPHLTFNFGAQYGVPVDDWEITLRGDYYRQSGSYARIYNAIGDRLRGWDNVNLSLTVARPADGLVFQAYVKNVFDKTPITDAFLNSDSTGMTTNVFTLDPRIIGFSIAKAF